MKARRLIEVRVPGFREAADNWRSHQAQKIFDLFEQTQGKPARTMEELEHWARSAKGKAALARLRAKEKKA
jgi:hypothetical protein